jgi:hypothetical protein
MEPVFTILPEFKPFRLQNKATPVFRFGNSFPGKEILIVIKFFLEIFPTGYY